MDRGSAFIRRQVSDGDPRSVDLSCDFLGPVAVSAMDDHYTAFLCEHAGDAFSDPATAACDERASALELKIHFASPLYRPLFTVARNLDSA